MKVKAKGGEPDNKPCDSLNLTERIIIAIKINSLNEYENEYFQFLNSFYSSAHNIQHVSLTFKKTNTHKQMLQKLNNDITQYTADQS